MGRLLVALRSHLHLRVLRLLSVKLLIRAVLTRLLALQSHLHGLSLLVEVDVCDVAAIEGQILLTHRVRVQSLIHSRSWLPLRHAAAATCTALGRRFVARGAG